MWELAYPSLAFSGLISPASLRMQPEGAQPEASPPEFRTSSQGNTKCRTSDRLRRAIAESPEPSDAPPTARRTLTRNSPQRGSSREMTPSEGTQVVKYTRTGRVSRANKGKRVHYCEECGKVRCSPSSLAAGRSVHFVIAITSEHSCDARFYAQRTIWRYRLSSHRMFLLNQ